MVQMTLKSVQSLVLKLLTRKVMPFLSSSVTSEQVIGPILASSELLFGQNLTFLIMNQSAVVWKITKHAKAW